MTRILSTLLALSLALMGCGTTLTLSDSQEIEGHIVSSTAEHIRVEPEPESLTRMRERGWLHEGYRGGPVDIPAEAVVDQSHTGSAATGLVFGTLALGTFASNLALGLGGQSLLSSYILMPFSVTFGSIAAPFIADWWDQALGGSRDLRLGLAITGTTVAALGPLLIPVAIFFANSDAFFLYVSGVMPTMMAVGTSLAIWGWERWSESEDDGIINGFSVAPGAVITRAGELVPAVGVSLTW